MCNSHTIIYHNDNQRARTLHNSNNQHLKMNYEIKQKAKKGERHLKRQPFVWVDWAKYVVDALFVGRAVIRCFFHAVI
jgi:hypothetical protein